MSSNQMNPDPNSTVRPPDKQSNSDPIVCIKGESVSARSVRVVDLPSPLVEKINQMLTTANYRLLAGDILEVADRLNQWMRDLASPVTAEHILAGYKRLGKGVVEFTLPPGVTIQQAGRILNIDATQGHLRSKPVFDENYSAVWDAIEQDPATRTVPGKTYRFTIVKDSTGKTREEQINDHGAPAPTGAAALAQSCERVLSDDLRSLFHDYGNFNGNYRYNAVRGSAPGIAVQSERYWETTLNHLDDNARQYRGGDIAYAALVA